MSKVVALRQSAGLCLNAYSNIRDADSCNAEYLKSKDAQINQRLMGPINVEGSVLS